MRKFKVGDRVRLIGAIDRGWESFPEFGEVIFVRPMDSESPYAYEIKYADTAGSFREDWLEEVVDTSAMTRWLS